MSTDGTLRLVLQDVRGKRLDERVDISLRHQVLSDQRLIKKVDASKIIVVGDLHAAPQGTYRITVDPPSYLTVSQFVNIKAGSPTDLTLPFPVDPKKIKAVKFPPFADLPEPARELLTASDTVNAFEGHAGEDLYDSVDPVRRAGFLNIVAKAGATLLGNGRPVLEYFSHLRELRGDRFFVVASKELRAETKNSVAEGLFRGVDGSMHHPPEGFAGAGSFKSEDHYGNLQLTFFLCGDDCLVDVDIDDAAGLAHVFQVARNELTGRPTHPYDIREILIAYQGIDPGYTFEL
jgi:hypothetical protein